MRGYLERLRRRIPVECLAVFGSRARGDHWSDSDIDVVVVSEAFRGMPRRERIGVLQEDWCESPALEPLGYTPEELLAADHPLLLEILSDGRPVSDQGVWEAGQARLARALEAGEWERMPGGWREGPARRST
ncbi:MAG: nucleotidyltransferase domain-containing protein [Candidatus Eremiobacterota bacterium]